MEFPFNINNLFGSEISKLDKSVTPFRRNADGFTYVDLRSQMFTVIDKMGDASSRAQGLHGTITGGRKLQLSDHTLYVMKDDNNNNSGYGAVVGILKIGHKKLFVYDRNGAVHELEPICVLDFYVHESRQRMGCGRKLFDYMLRDINVRSTHLAIDKPSYKFSEFLKKHYNLKTEVPQVNNFVVFEGFFNNRPDTGAGDGRRRYGNRPPMHPDSNFGNVESIVQKGRSYSNYGRFKRNYSRPNSGQLSSRSAPPNQIEEELYNYDYDDHLENYSAQTMASLNTQGTDHVYTMDHPNLRELEMPVPVGMKDLDIDPLLDVSDKSVHLNLQPLNSTLNSRAYGAGANMYSRHSDTPPEGRGSHPNDSVYNHRARSRSNSRTSGGSRANGHDHDNLRLHSPPLLQRAEAEMNYKDNLNLHQDYQGRAGHLKVNISPSKLSSLPSITSHVTPSILPNLTNNAYNAGYTNYGDRYKPLHHVTNWTPGGAAPSHQSIGARHYAHTRLW